MLPQKSRTHKEATKTKKQQGWEALLNKMTKRSRQTIRKKAKKKTKWWPSKRLYYKISQLEWLDEL